MIDTNTGTPDAESVWTKLAGVSVDTSTRSGLSAITASGFKSSVRPTASFSFFVTKVIPSSPAYLESALILLVLTSPSRISSVPYVRETIRDGFSGILTSLPAPSVSTRPVELFSAMQPVSVVIARKQQKKIRKNFFITPLKESRFFYFSLHFIRTNNCMKPSNGRADQHFLNH